MSGCEAEGNLYPPMLHQNKILQQLLEPVRERGEKQAENEEQQMRTEEFGEVVEGPSSFERGK